MSRKTTLGVTKETRERVHRFKSASGVRSVDDAINHALDIAESDEDGSESISVERIEELESQQERLASAFMELREQMNHHHSE